MALGAMAIPLLDCAGRNREIKKNLIPPAFLSRICDAKTIRGIGEAYNARFPARASEDTLIDLLLADEAGPGATRQSGETETRSFLEKKIQKDFNTANTVVMNGWILSVTEAQQAALFSIMTS